MWSQKPPKCRSLDNFVLHKYTKKISKNQIFSEMPVFTVHPALLKRNRKQGGSSPNLIFE